MVIAFKSKIKHGLYFMVADLAYKFQMMQKGNLNFWIETWEMCISQKKKKKEKKK